MKILWWFTHLIRRKNIVLMYFIATVAASIGIAIEERSVWYADTLLRIPLVRRPNEARHRGVTEYQVYANYAPYRRGSEYARLDLGYVGGMMNRCERHRGSFVIRSVLLVSRIPASGYWRGSAYADDGAFRGRTSTPEASVFLDTRRKIPIETVLALRGEDLCKCCGNFRTFFGSRSLLETAARFTLRMRRWLAQRPVNEPMETDTLVLNLPLGRSYADTNQW